MRWDESLTGRRKQGSSSSFDFYICNKQVADPSQGWLGAQAFWPGRLHMASSSKMHICKRPLCWTITHGAQGREIIHFCSFLINPKLWISATAVTGNVRAVGLPTPACDEWSTMWGENHCVLFRKVKADQGFFYTAANEEGNVELHFSPWRNTQYNINDSF